MFKKIAIVGVGLIGGSLGLAIKKKALAQKVLGIGHRRKSLDEALAAGAVDQAYLGIENIRGADLVILAAPVMAIIEIIPQLHKYLDKGAIVIDAGSTKAEIIKTAQRHRLNFIGCHPLAGMEKKGPRQARAELFKDSWCLITPSKGADKASLAKVKSLWQELGAKVKLLDGRVHDKILAFTSHLPHFIVFSLLNCLKEEHLEFAAGGLKDTTRIGLSDPLLWRDIFLTNRRELLFALGSFKKSLNHLEQLLRSGRTGSLQSYLERSRSKRDEF